MHVRSLRAVGAVLLAAALVGCASGGGGGPEVVPPRDGASAAPSATVAGATAPVGEPNVLVLNATGTATVRSLTYVVEGETVTETSVRLPWRKSFTLPSDQRQEWSLVVEHEQGDIHVTATVNDALVTQGAGGGTGTGTVSVSGTINP